MAGFPGQAFFYYFRYIAQFKRLCQKVISYQYLFPALFHVICLLNLFQWER